VAWRTGAAIAAALTTPRSIVASVHDAGSSGVTPKIKPSIGSARATVPASTGCDQSERNVATGSTRAARRALSQVAAAATARMKVVMRAKVSGSVGSIS